MYLDCMNDTNNIQNFQRILKYHKIRIGTTTCKCSFRGLSVGRLDTVSVRCLVNRIALVDRQGHVSTPGVSGLLHSSKEITRG